MNGEKVTTCEDKLVFKITGKIFTLSGDVLKMITDYKFNRRDSPDAKLIIDNMDEIRFEIHSRGKSLSDRSLLRNYFNTRALLASGLKTS